MSLRNAMVAPTLPVVDVERAKKFYRDTLGLRLAGEHAETGELWFEAGQGSMIMLYKRSATKADNTAAGFQVDDLDATMKELRSKGVKFEEYDFPGLKTVNGVATIDGERGAWFKDTEGNILAVVEMRE